MTYGRKSLKLYAFQTYWSSQNESAWMWIKVIRIPKDIEQGSLVTAVKEINQVGQRKLYIAERLDKSCNFGENWYFLQRKESPWHPKEICAGMCAQCARKWSAKEGKQRSDCDDGTWWVNENEEQLWRIKKKKALCDQVRGCWISW